MLRADGDSPFVVTFDSISPDFSISPVQPDGEVSPFNTTYRVFSWQEIESGNPVFDGGGGGGKNYDASEVVASVSLLDGWAATLDETPQRDRIIFTNIFARTTMTYTIFKEEETFDFIANNSGVNWTYSYTAQPNEFKWSGEIQPPVGGFGPNSTIFQVTGEVVFSGTPDVFNTGFFDVDNETRLLTLATDVMVTNFSVQRFAIAGGQYVETAYTLNPGFEDVGEFVNHINACPETHCALGFVLQYPTFESSITYDPSLSVLLIDDAKEDGADGDAGGDGDGNDGDGDGLSGGGIAGGVLGGFSVLMLCCCFCGVVLCIVVVLVLGVGSSAIATGTFVGGGINREGMVAFSVGDLPQSFEGDE